MDKIAVSVLGKNNKIALINKLITKGITTIHYDIMDGKFVKNIAMQEPEMNNIFTHTKSHIINIHLMVYNPLKYIKIYQKTADFITFHYESLSIPEIRFIIKNYDHKKLGIAINPDTDIKVIYEFLPYLSHILIMSVRPGQGGQKFIFKTIFKLKKLKAKIDQLQLNCFIQVDGGINNETGPLCFKAGAKNVVSGSFLLNHLNDKNIIKKITG